MTPFMPQKYTNPCRPDDPVLDPCNDVEAKNALAVQTVQAQGVSRINDLYAVVTGFCGKVYKNCSICDDESKYHPQGMCGDHYVDAGWHLLANSTSQSILAALSDANPARSSPDRSDNPQTDTVAIEVVSTKAPVSTTGTGSNVTRIAANTREDLGATSLVLTKAEMRRVGKAGERAAAARASVAGEAAQVRL